MKRFLLKFLGIIIVILIVLLGAVWFGGRWIANRPLFMLAILMIIVGIQVVFFGLLADLSLFNSRRRDPPAIRKYLE